MDEVMTVVLHNPKGKWKWYLKPMSIPREERGTTVSKEFESCDAACADLDSYMALRGMCHPPRDESWKQ